MKLSRRVLLAGPAVLRGRFQLFAQSPATYSRRTVQLVEESTVVDLLNQFSFTGDSTKPPEMERWLTQPGAFTKDDAATYINSGIKVFALGRMPHDYAEALRFIAKWNGFIAAYPDILIRIDSPRSFDRVRGTGKIGVMLTSQNSSHFRSPADVQEFYALGQRISQLTYNYGNMAGSGFLENRDGGLSVFGLAILSKMQEIGMAVDLSHCGDQTTLDALEAASAPVLFTHAACRTLVSGHPRAKTDDAIRKLAKTGGLMGIMFINCLVRDRDPVTVEHVVDHYDYVRKLVGVEHLAVGSDLDVVGNVAPAGLLAEMSKQANFGRYRWRPDGSGRVTIRNLDHPKRTFDLAEAFVRRGYSDRDIKLILAGNAVRVLGQLWSTAKHSRRDSQ